MMRPNEIPDRGLHDQRLRPFGSTCLPLCTYPAVLFTWLFTSFNSVRVPAWPRRPCWPSSPAATAASIRCRFLSPGLAPTPWRSVLRGQRAASTALSPSAPQPLMPCNIGPHRLPRDARNRQRRFGRGHGIDDHSSRWQRLLRHDATTALVDYDRPSGLYRISNVSFPAVSPRRRPSQPDPPPSIRAVKGPNAHTQNHHAHWARRFPPPMAFLR